MSVKCLKKQTKNKNSSDNGQVQGVAWKVSENIAIIIRPSKNYGSSTVLKMTSFAPSKENIKK